MEGEGLSEFLCSFEALSMMLPVLFFQLYSPFVLQLVLELCKLDLNLAQAIMREDLGVGPLRARRRRGLLAIVAAVVGAAARPVPDCEFIRLDVARGAGAAGCQEGEGGGGRLREREFGFLVVLGSERETSNRQKFHSARRLPPRREKRRRASHSLLQTSQAAWRDRFPSTSSPPRALAE